MTHFKKMSAFTIINFIPKIFTTQKKIMEISIRNKHWIFIFSVLMETLNYLTTEIILVVFTTLNYGHLSLYNYFDTKLKCHSQYTTTGISLNLVYVLGSVQV